MTANSQTPRYMAPTIGRIKKDDNSQDPIEAVIIEKTFRKPELGDNFRCQSA